jgi:hypothetical protein
MALQCDLLVCLRERACARSGAGRPRARRRCQEGCGGGPRLRATRSFWGQWQCGEAIRTTVESGRRKSARQRKCSEPQGLSSLPRAYTRCPACGDGPLSERRRAERERRVGRARRPEAKVICQRSERHRNRSAALRRVKLVDRWSASAPTRASLAAPRSAGQEPERLPLPLTASQRIGARTQTARTQTARCDRSHRRRRWRARERDSGLSPARSSSHFREPRCPWPWSRASAPWR